MKMTIDASGSTLEAELTFVADDAPLPDGGDICISLARWQKEVESLQSRPGLVAVKLANTEDVMALTDDVLSRPLLLLDFPSFADGRAYSQARLLRDARNYGGDIRATGEAVVRDQVAGMLRSGISSFELRHDQSAEVLIRAVKDFSIPYQAGANYDRAQASTVRQIRLDSTSN